MAKVVVKSKIKKAKRKFPIEIKAPEYLNSKSLGHSHVTDLNTLVGKTTKMNLMYLTGNVRNQNVRLVFAISEVASGVAQTVVKSYSQVSYFMRRFVKQGSDLLEDSAVYTTKDGLNVRVKPFMVTKGKTSGLVSTALRAELNSSLKKEISEKTYAEFMSAVISGKIQLVFKNNLKTILPLKSFEFKKIELVSNN